MAYITYATNVFRLDIIKAFVLSASLWAMSPSALEARDLTSQEQSVCGTLRTCLDITSRHSAIEFDYTVLEAEFRRLGPRGRHALFSLLESEKGHADIAALILKLGPLSPIERQRITQKWRQQQTQNFMPFLLDGHPMSRDLLLQSLEHSNSDTREQARRALLRLPQSAQQLPLSKPVQTSLLRALKKDPIVQAAPYLKASNAAGFEDEFIALLGSGESEIVTAAYTALYRNSPAKAFNGLLAQMKRIETPAQARAIGDMLALRHKSRKDGFYLQFARKMSGDSQLLVLARASGLHAALTIADGPFPDLTPARSAAFAVLVEGQPITVQQNYLPYLQRVKAQSALSYIWKVAQSEQWINRDVVAEYYAQHPSYPAVLSNLIASNDFKTFSAGLKKAKAQNRASIQGQINHPVKQIDVASRKYLKLRPAAQSAQTCPVSLFDLEDMREQMPFFESGWIVADNSARVSLAREHLTTAHPTVSGWLAGYDLAASNSRPQNNGGAILYYDNTSGEFDSIGEFSSPLAILPDRPLKLGQSTQSFWVIDRWGPERSDISAFTLTLSARKPVIKHVGLLPDSARGFSLSPSGELVITFDDKAQMPIKLSKTGTMSLYCLNKSAGISPRAPK